MTALPSAPPRPAGRAPIAVAAGVGAACVALAVWNPGDQGTAICPTRAIFGLDCPVCGGMRAVASLGRLDPLAAADHNVLVLALVPVMVAWWVWWWWADRRGDPAPRLRLPRWAWVTFAVVVVAFTVVRNLDAGPVSHWLAASRA
jgi:hypothetical protein